MSVCVCLCLCMSLCVCVYVYNVHVNTIAGHTYVTPAHVLRGSVRFQTEPHYSGQSLRLRELCSAATAWRKLLFLSTAVYCTEKCQKECMRFYVQ